MKTYTNKNVDEAIQYYVNNGYVVFRNLVDIQYINNIEHYVNNCIEICKNKFKTVDYHEMAVSIMNKMENSSVLRNVTDNDKLLNVMIRILGPDIAIFNFDALWLNVPKDKNPVLNKDLHTDAWTGTSVNTIFAKFFCTDCDEYNGLVVAPGSHLQGLIPVRNRAIDKNADATFKTNNLHQMEMGDFIFWHPLLLHSTTGHSAKNVRLSITSRYTSTETGFSSQERALGYRTLKVGPNNQIKRIVGNDNLLPFRTFGGFVGVDKRMRKVYGLSEYQETINYNEYLPPLSEKSNN